MKILKKLFVLTLILLLSPSVVFAQTKIFFDPSDGYITAGKNAIDLVVDSGGDEIDGLEITIEYSGDISFMDFDTGDIPGCAVDGLEREDYDDIFLYCFIMGESYVGSDGVFATLNFESTGNGTATIEITNVDGVSSVDFTQKGQYQTTTSTTAPTPEVTPQPETTPAPVSADPLPRTSVFSTMSIFIGTALLAVPIVLNIKPFSEKKRLMSEKLT